MRITALHLLKVLALLALLFAAKFANAQVPAGRSRSFGGTFMQVE